MGNRHGCCADKACNSSTCMELPAGKTCGDCAHFARCKAFLSLNGTETSCDWFPRRFRLSNARVIEEADAAIAAEHPHEPHYITPKQAELLPTVGVQPSEKVQLPEKARAGIEVLRHVVESLLTTSRYVDEEGEATLALADMASCIADPPFKLNDASGVKTPVGISREAWLKACGDYCAPDGTCSCAKFADDPAKCERRKEMEAAYDVALTSKASDGGSNSTQEGGA